MCRSLPIACTTTSPELRPTRSCAAPDPGAAHRLGGGLHGRLHGQGGIAGAQGVVFGNRGAKQSHNAIAEHLIHRALKVVHGIHHELDSRIEELLGGFGIEPSMSSVEALRSAKSTVTCLRSSRPGEPRGSRR